jgi:nickel-dependent lactate racemase
MGVHTVELPYGHGALKAHVSSETLQGVLLPRQRATPADETTLLREALAHPLHTARLQEMVRVGQRIVIVTSDLTRPCPSARLLSPVLQELALAGIPDQQITIVIALGLHRRMTEAELEAAVGPEVYRRVRVINHDPEDCVPLGITSIGTPVEIFRPVVEADFRICLGNLELHYFAGYSGGAKAILPGCASRTTLNANHSLMVRPEARAGRLEGNPVRADLEEGASMLDIDFILNVVVGGPDHRIVGAVAGAVTAAHRRGCALVAERGIVEIESQADIVMVSAGGHPKDVNLYQAQKALDNASYALRDGGVLILAAECSEGFGHRTFEAWLTDATPDQVLARIQQEFVLGGHKAAAVAGVLRRAWVYLASALPDDLVRRCGMTPFANLDSALAAALERSSPGASLLVLPQGASILPLADRQDTRTY